MSPAYPRRTERLLLRPLREDDVDVIVEYRNDPDVAELQDWDLPVPRDRVKDQIERHAGWDDIVPGVARQIGIECDGELIGDLYVSLDEHGGVAEIGFTLRTAYQGKGYAYEAASALVADLIERLGCHRIVAQLSPKNTRSARLLERLGMHVESLAPKSFWCRGAWDDNLVYAMSGDEWRESGTPADRTEAQNDDRTNALNERAVRELNEPIRISTVDELLNLLDQVVAAHERGDRTSRSAESFWTAILTAPNHPLNSQLPDEPLVDWNERGLLGDLNGARVLDIGCGNGRNAAWLARQGATVIGIDIATSLLDASREHMPPGVTLQSRDVLREELPEGSFDLVYDSGCFHHLAPHRRITYLTQVMPKVRSTGRYGIVTFAQEQQPSPRDIEILTSGDTAGGISFTLTDLEEIFGRHLECIEARSVNPGSEQSFGAPFLHAALFRRG